MALGQDRRSSRSDLQGRPVLRRSLDQLCLSDLQLNPSTNDYPPTTAFPQTTRTLRPTIRVLTRRTSLWCFVVDSGAAPRN
jgi:hypothetical protein